MKLSRDTIVIGGLPNPIGGVTTFLSRLVRAYPQFVLAFIDLYVSNDKRIPSNYKGEYILVANKLLAIFKILLLQFKYKEKEIFFNFSSGNSLVFFLLLPKFNNEWSLMLHHGHLESKLPRLLLRFILNKFDTIYTLNERQAEFYKSIKPCYPLVEETSYVPAVLVNISDLEKLPLNKAREQNLKIIVGSGFPRPLYQHHILIDLINKNKNTFLFLFLYGDGELKEELLNLNHSRVKVFLDKREDIFNFYLSEADIYVRPTLEDSFGIACADSVEFGTTVIASNVCKRYLGVNVFDLSNPSEIYNLFYKSLNENE